MDSNRISQMTEGNVRCRPTFLTVSLLRELLDYNPENGIFTWRKTGKIAGNLNPNGHVYIGIRGYYFKAHRLAWFYIYEEWAGLLDHKDQRASNNAISNLRKATASQNQANKSIYINNMLRVKGVKEKPSGRYEARIRVNKRLLYLGTFDTIEEAREAYKQAAIEHFGEFACVK